MADQFGMSFSPAQSGPGQPQNGQRPSPVQQAIQTLSLRIPKNAGASAFTPQTLLDSPGGAGLGGDANSAAILEAIKRMLFGGQMGGSRVGTGPQLPRDAGMGGGTMPGPVPGGFDPGASGMPGGPSSLIPHFSPIEGAPGPATGGGFGPPEASGGGSGGPGGPYSDVFAGAPAPPSPPVPYDSGAAGRPFQPPPSPYSRGQQT